MRVDKYVLLQDILHLPDDWQTQHKIRALVIGGRFPTQDGLAQLKREPVRTERGLAFAERLRQLYLSSPKKGQEEMRKKLPGAESQSELDRYLEKLPSMDAASAGLDDIAELERAPAFVADFLKSQLVEHILQAMEEQHLNKTDLAKRLNTSRQYVSRVLNEKANFTVDSIAEIACALGMGVRLELYALSIGKPGARGYSKRGRRSLATTGRGQASDYSYVAEDGDE